MSAISFLTAVSPLGNRSGGDTPTKAEKQDDTRLQKGTVVLVKMVFVKGCVACWQKNQDQRNLISVW